MRNNLDTAMNKYVRYFFSVTILSVIIVVLSGIFFLDDWAQAAVAGLSFATATVLYDFLLHRNVFARKKRKYMKK